ncbi:hypothetical protein [Streptomyces longisporoflavus]|uniref:Uncharacterized protein n=1 Tax=Streptomyces longisporoflavus TaxID=28044 RepID=A0ABW7QWS4_9ACTN|nr:hypothetical protein [Streptomyces longisporoflavus]GGV49179.1 hypothetical protein GCM10010277_42820 [Streptomyces longisporoflavus]
MDDDADDFISPARLLPWPGPEGKPCYLIGDATGPVSRVADAMESVQLGMGGELLTYARGMIPDASETEIRYLAQRLTEALQDALRVAESRGLRLR